jgi:protein SCO1/2
MIFWPILSDMIPLHFPGFSSCRGLLTSVRAKSAAAGGMLLLGMILLMGGCDRPVKTGNQPGEVRYEVRGIVRGLPPDGQTIEVEHEDIRGFMPSMTMPFVARNRKEIGGLRMGDAISFRLSVTQNDSSIDQIKKIPPQEVHLPAATATPEKSSNGPRLHEGDAMPVFRLLDQDGKRISLESFRGHPFVLTFIFTRCPVPNFCPRMSRNFADLQTAVKSATGLLSQARLLSISFDPAFDTPQVLKSFAEHAGADPAVWTFATGEKAEIDDLTHAFSVYVQAEGGTLSHGLATALVDGGGNVRKIWRGNEWKPEEVLQAIRGASN